MDYYHVRVTQKSDRTHDEVRLDLTREELEERFLVPYRRGLPIIIGGKSIQNDDIERIRITKTVQDSSHLAKVVEEERSRRIANGVFDIGGPPNTERIANKGEDVSDEFITGPPGSDSNPASHSIQEVKPATDAREVFVVHGRNGDARDALFQLLRAFDLHPLEWSEAVSATGKASPYIGEILDTAFSRAHAVVVLFTPDDEARLREPFRADNDPPHETQLTGQARPNVLFEAGMAMARDQNRTVLVELGSLRPFSDVAGRHAIRLDNSSQRRQELAQRLQLAGCPVKLTGTDWHTAGDFAAALDNLVQESSNSTAVVEQQSPIANPIQLSEEARELIVEAIKDASGIICKSQTFSGLNVETNGRNFVKTGNRRSAARYEQAIQDLRDHGLVKDPKGKGEVFEVTQKGFEIADGLGTSPRSDSEG